MLQHYVLFRKARLKKTGYEKIGSNDDLPAAYSEKSKLIDDGDHGKSKLRQLLVILHLTYD